MKMEWKSMKKIFIVLFLVLFASSCGGSATGPSTFNLTSPIVVNPSIDANLSSLGELSAQEQIIAGKEFGGYLIVDVYESLEIETDESGNIDTSNKEENNQNNIDELRSTFSKYPSLVVKSFVDPTSGMPGVPAATPKRIRFQRKLLEKKAGKKLPDLASRIRLESENLSDLILVFRDLKQKSYIKDIFVQTALYPTGNDGEGPNVSMHQLYLDDLGVQSAWDANIYGQGVMLVDSENGISFEHEDLNVRATKFENGGNYFSRPRCAPGFAPEINDCELWIEHGTSVMGVLGSKHQSRDGLEEVGIKGLVPDSSRIIQNPAGLAGITIVPEGSIYLLEYGQTISGNGRGLLNCDDCVTPLLKSYMANDIATAIARGVTVISGAGNNALDLDDESIYENEGMQRPNNESMESLIIVGASEGMDYTDQNSEFRHSNQMRRGTTCGSDVSLHSWGNFVVTSGYEYSGNLLSWIETSGIFPGLPGLPGTNNSYYVNNFGGTSSAAAIVAGAATLIQSYAKQQFGFPITRYLTPKKLKEILVVSGTDQHPGDECNIGKQPNVAAAMQLVDAFVTQISAEFPGVLNGDTLPSVEDQDALEARGLGLICEPFYIEGQAYTAHGDTSCAEGSLWPTGMRIGKDYDVDGDGKADLISWKKGEWKVDLSSVGDGEDKLGAWDRTYSYNTAEFNGATVWPYVIDLNSDGRADFVLIDKDHGKWYITYTNTDLLKYDVWPGWNDTFDHSAAIHDQLDLDPLQSTYCRPVPGDYNFVNSPNIENWNDLALACSDGYWRIKFGGPNGFDAVTVDEPSVEGGWDLKLRYLSDEQLADAPGWAYLPVSVNQGSAEANISFKIPDTLASEGKLYWYPAAPTQPIDPDALPENWIEGLFNQLEGLPNIFGGNDTIVVLTVYNIGNHIDADIGMKSLEGSWKVFGQEVNDFIPANPDNIYGGAECSPIAADFDGDGYYERAVQCPDEWRIAFADGQVKTIPLSYNENDFVLPGRPYFGGISYERAQELIEVFQENFPNTPPPLFVDMVK
ncbi:MAG: hypothetical protein COX62_03030 [Deltaproteobacteria bacterium CG_4_10_14_0_2_um_filter_43_8]|nr:MAG: hypothetical protein COX62_03030 [Deltaproteobacteria bacterium CG_4_10_14_0_2_um_filter_43_8]PJC64962.1 MAG: hypothetical protein CO021_01625 [Deltaproteobacteria bacterium CG_4_9_14_0_2_um_filter_42_21]